MTPFTRPALFLFNRKRIREVDARAIADFHIPEVVLMENAARHLASVTFGLLSKIPSPRILIICGTGNNGGDGLAAARHLSNAGRKVSLLLTGTPPPKTLAALHLKICRAMKIKIVKTIPSDTQCIIDCIFGTGLDRPITGPILTLIENINSRGDSGTLIISADIPSGLDADTGQILGACVNADVTVTFAGIKQGMLTPNGLAHCGEITVGDIGAPTQLIARLGKRVKS